MQKFILMNQAISNAANSIKSVLTKKSLSLLSYYPFLITWYFILHFYANNQEGLTVAVLAQPLFFATIITGLVLYLLKGVYKDWHKASLATLVAVAAFLGYGHVMSTLPNITVIIGERVIGKPFIIISLLGALTLYTFWVIFHTNKKLIKSTGLLNLVALFLVGLNIINIVPTEWQRIANSRQAVRQDKQQELVSTAGQSNLPYQPDIYYLIYDRYGGNKTLKDYYNYDNSDFSKHLSDKGFYVAEESIANYPRTIFSLSSSLNLSYVQDLVEMDNPAKSEATTLKWLYSNSAVAQILKNQGYTYYHIGNWYENTHAMDIANKNILPTQRDFPHEDFFNSKLLATTPYPEFTQKYLTSLVPKEWNVQHQQWSIFQKDSVKSLVANKGPKFIVSHMLMPHEPYVFESDCTPRHPGVGAPWASLEDYSTQVQCTNKIIIETVEEILDKSEKPPIIIVQGDEGPEPHAHEMTNHTTFHNASMGAVLERSRIFNAYYFPDKNYKNLYQTITPVNSFRVVLNQYFDMDFSKVEDKNYVFWSSEDMFDLIDVTNQIKAVESEKLASDAEVQSLVDRRHGEASSNTSN